MDAILYQFCVCLLLRREIIEECIGIRRRRFLAQTCIGNRLLIWLKAQDLASGSRILACSLLTFIACPLVWGSEALSVKAGRFFFVRRAVSPGTPIPVPLDRRSVG